MRTWLSNRKRRRKLLLGTLVAMLVAGAIYVAWLDHVIRSQFDGRRWTVPTQVYARPLELRAGLPLSSEALESELKRLGYRASREAKPGTYRKRAERIDIQLRKARFAGQVREPLPLRVVVGSQAISAVQDAEGGELRRAHLEPLLIGSLFPVHGEDRLVVAPDDVPALLPMALKIIEDRNFDSHPGIDVKAILRAAWANLRAGRVEQGGSTLTQQLVKSYFLDESRSLRRKAQEAIMAMRLEARYEKADLMNAYINEIYLGQDGERAIHGFGLASRFYFGKPIDELGLADIALLVGMVRGPSYYNPRANPERAKERRNFVLARLAEFQVVPEAEATAASKRPLGIVPRDAGGYYPAYLDYVRRQLRRDYGDEVLDEPGLQVFTNLDPRVQVMAERTVDEELKRLDRRGASKKSRLEAALVVTEPGTGEVVAIVGGRESQLAGFNRALDARRPIGSLVKPIVYLAALESNQYHAASQVYDEPVVVRLAAGKDWRPQNFDHESQGPMPLVRALADSRNLATVQLGLELGIEPVARKFTALGLDREPARVPALLLGSADLTPIEVAQLYNAIANGGAHRPLHAVQAVVTHDGRTLPYQPREPRQAADADAVYQLNRMLTQVMSHGTGSAAAALLPEGLVTAGKTGTSSDLRDGWFAGFSGSHLIVVWIGHDDNAPTGLTGSLAALPVWAKLMGRIGTQSWSAPIPDSLEEVWVDYETGLIAEPGCAEVVIPVVVPRGTPIDHAFGCWDPDFGRFCDRVRAWWQRLTD